MKTFLIVLAIIPWSLLIGLAYLAYRRVRSQQRMADAFIEMARVTEPMSNERKQWMNDVVETSKIAERICTRLAPHVCKTNGPCNGWPREEALMQQKPLEGWKVSDADYVAKMGRA